MRWTTNIFALRVPLSCVLALGLLAPLGAFPFSPLRGMLEGLFDLSGWGAFWAGLSSWLSAAACWLCSSLILNYGPRRIPGMHRIATDLEFRAFPWLGLAFSLAPLSLLAGVCTVSVESRNVLSGSAAGFAVSLAAWRLIDRLHLHPGFAAERAAGWLLWLDRAGYRDPSSGRLLPGHWIAFQFATAFILLWGLIGTLKYLALRDGREAVILPTSVTFAVLMIGLLSLTLSAFSFFFDRYRVPVLLPWLALLAVTSLVPSADQFVATVPAARRPLAQPAGILAPIPFPILVCASGGGIAASAWTAAVLAGLDHLHPSRFTSSLALISGASGGSVGGMQFLAACHSPNGCGDAFGRASRSSLDAAAWGLVGPDFVRATVPFAGAFLGDVGRGWALEQAWDPGQALRFGLSAWPARPAVVFNATLVETGEGIGFANVDLGNAIPGFNYLLRNKPEPDDFALVTAARLSASFPFVTPTPRTRQLPYHFADGGYYDNYGVGAAVAFLEQAYRDSASASALPRRVLLIEIRANPARRPKADSTGAMMFQWHSPADTILNVRDTAQRRRNDTTIALLGEALAAHGVRLERVVFEIPRRDVPLSWHLTAAQSAAIRRDWEERFAHSPEAEAVARFLSQRPSRGRV